MSSIQKLSEATEMNKHEALPDERVFGDDRHAATSVPCSTIVVAIASIIFR